MKILNLNLINIMKDGWQKQGGRKKISSLLPSGYFSSSSPGFLY